MKDFIDLVSLLRQYKQIDVRLQGKIVEEIPRPSNLYSNVRGNQDCVFVRMDVFSVNLKSIKSYLYKYGYSEPDDTYMVNGSVCLYINKTAYKFPQFYDVEARLMFGTQDTSSNYIIGFGFSKLNTGWVIIPNRLKDIDTAYILRATTKYRLLQESISSNRVTRTQAVSALPEFRADLAPIFSYTLNQPKQPKEAEPTPEPRYIRPKMTLENRKVIKAYSPTVCELNNILEKANIHKQEYIKSLKDTYTENTDMCNPYIDYMLKGLLDNLKSKPEGTGYTGNKILSKYLSGFANANEEYLGGTVSQFIINNFAEVSEFIRSRAVVKLDGVAWGVCKTAFLDREYFYANVLGIITKVSCEELSNIERVCSTNCISFSRLVNENPYALQLLGNLKFHDIEHIAMCLGKSDSYKLNKDRNIAMLNSYIQSTDNNNNSTLYRKKALQNAEIGVIISSSRFEKLKSQGTYLTNETSANIRAYLYNTRGLIGYDTRNFVLLNNGSGINRISSSEFSQIVKDYIDSGLGIEYNGYITSSELLKKELYVYNAMYSLGKQTYDYPREEIEKYIAEYEGNIGFQLEPAQKEAVYLLLHGAGIISGSAGSGKTTISNCLVYCIERLEPDMILKFGAPTGKAAKRMQEVVKRPVKTYHSLFKLGLTSSTLLDDPTKDNGLDEAEVVYFFDENAMTTLDTFYAMLKKIDLETSRIYLFGDFNQLPPIGKGTPFKNLLRFMPCVCLTTVKRAVEGSNITLNSDYINNYSEGSNWKELVSAKDFFTITAKEQDITTAVTLLVKHYLGKGTPEEEKRLCMPLRIPHLPEVQGITADDIQVVSPLSKANYTWGTTRLNTALQPVFNQHKGYDYTVINKKPKTEYYTKYLIGDRVIHTTKNMYTMQHYLMPDFKDNTIQKTYGYGICNGEVGKIVGILPSKGLVITKEQGKASDEFRYPENMRDDTTHSGYFLVVEYYDYITDSKYCILYRCFENTDSPMNIGKTLYGEDFDKLMLFYAGTTHKMQGSQAKIIISVLGDVKYNGFITRNMIYTTITRGEKLVFCIGSVGNNRNSMLSKARTEIAGSRTLTVGEIL